MAIILVGLVFPACPFKPPACPFKPSVGLSGAAVTAGGPYPPSASSRSGGYCRVPGCEASFGECGGQVTAGGSFDLLPHPIRHSNMLPAFVTIAPCPFHGMKSAIARLPFQMSGQESKANRPKNKPSGMNFSTSSASAAAPSPALRSRFTKSRASMDSSTFSGQASSSSSTRASAETSAKPDRKPFVTFKISPATIAWMKSRDT